VRTRPSLFEEEELSLDNIVQEKESATFRTARKVEVADSRRPVYGVLTEPLRGDMVSTSSGETVGKHESKMSYIPKAHVQFLEQSGIIVVPISYLDTEEQMLATLAAVNGVYITGDSHRAIGNDQYQAAFKSIQKFVSEANKEEHDYFPMFLMGKSAQTFVIQNAAGGKTALKQMRQYRNVNVQVELLKEHDETFLLHQLQFDASHAHAFDMGTFFNRQSTGLRLRDLESDSRLKKMITPLASFLGSGDAKNSMSMDSSAEKEYSKENEFIAIAEGSDLPIYIFTYNIEMTQFVYTDLMQHPEQSQVIDKTILCRHHAQFVSQQIADEARLNNHGLTEERDFTQGISQHTLASVEYPSDTSEVDQAQPLPKGLEKHDIYIIKQ